MGRGSGVTGRSTCGIGREAVEFSAGSAEDVAWTLAWAPVRESTAEESWTQEDPTRLARLVVFRR